MKNKIIDKGLYISLGITIGLVLMSIIVILTSIISSGTNYCSKTLETYSGTAIIQQEKKQYLYCNDGSKNYQYDVMLNGDGRNIDMTISNHKGDKEINIYCSIGEYDKDTLYRSYQILEL